MDRSRHRNSDCLKERGVDKGSGRRSIFPGWERSVFSQTNIPFDGNLGETAESYDREWTLHTDLFQCWSSQ